MAGYNGEEDAEVSTSAFCKFGRQLTQPPFK